MNLILTVINFAVIFISGVALINVVGQELESKLSRIYFALIIANTFVNGLFTYHGKLKW